MTKWKYLGKYTNTVSYYICLGTIVLPDGIDGVTVPVMIREDYYKKERWNHIIVIRPEHTQSYEEVVELRKFWTLEVFNFNLNRFLSVNAFNSKQEVYEYIGKFRPKKYRIVLLQEIEEIVGGN